MADLIIRDVAFAMLQDDPDTVAVIEHAGVCWPYSSLEKARRTARKVGLPGIWRVKPKGNV